MRMRWSVLPALVVLGACQPAVEPADNAADALANLVAGLDAPDNRALPTPDPAPYVPAPDEPGGDNAMSSAVPGLVHYRDLPAARVLKGRWVVEDADWFAVAGKTTPPRSAAALAALKGAKVTVERGRIGVTLAGANRIPALVLDCEDAGYLDKDRLVAAELRDNLANATREDALRTWSVAVAERELSERFYKSGTLHAQLIAASCREPDPHDEQAYVMSGVLPIERDLIVLVYGNGIAALARRAE